MKNYIIRRETKDDYRNVENLVRESFWNVYRPGCTEPYLIHCLRNDPAFVSDLDFVMEIDGKIMGQIIFMHSEIAAYDGRTVPIMTFGPISIAPEYKRQGYGKILLDYALEKAADMGAGAVCIEGNIDFYGKSGFIVAGTIGIDYHAQERGAYVPYFLCKELKKGFLAGVKGVYHTPKAYYIDDNEAEEFDKQFPPKQKLKLPGQLFG